MANKKSLALTKEQYENLIGSMKKGGNTFRANDRIATALVLEANLGLRIGDILKLRLQDIVLDGGRYRLDITEEKTQKKRIFTVPQPIYQYLRVYCIDHLTTDAGGYLDIKGDWGRLFLLLDGECGGERCPCLFHPGRPCKQCLMAA